LPYYWHDSAPWADRDCSLADRADLESAITENDGEVTPQLHSINEIKGYYIQALDGKVGRLEDCLVDDQTWGIVALAIDTTSKWVPVSRNVLLYLESTERVSFADKSIQVFFPIEDVSALPEYDPDEYRDPYYEA
jgi:hypothetical protein